MASNVAFEILYREYYVRVFGLCRKLLNSAPLAEDAAQETFMRAYRHFDRFDSTQPFWQWIATIANRHCIDLLRQRTRNGTLFGDESVELELLESADKAPPTLIADAQQANALNEAIAALPDKYRVPLILAYIDDNSYEEIAACLDISKNHVGVLLLRAKQQLRKRLDEHQHNQKEAS